MAILRERYTYIRCLLHVLKTNKKQIMEIFGLGERCQSDVESNRVPAHAGGSRNTEEASETDPLLGGSRV